MSLSDIEREQIAEQIKEGITSGQLDTEVGETGSFNHVSWELEFVCWQDD